MTRYPIQRCLYLYRMEWRSMLNLVAKMIMDRVIYAIVKHTSSHQNVFEL